MQPFELTKAEGNLRVLRVFHFVFSGLTLLGLGFLALHYLVMSTMMRMKPAGVAPAEAGENPPVVIDPDLDQIMDIMIWIYVGIGLVFILIGGLNLLSAIWMGSRKNRLFSMVVGGVNCINVPLGTVLGVFTIIFLVKPEARVLYGEISAPIHS